MVKKQDLHNQVKITIASSAEKDGSSFGKGTATLLHGIRDNGSLNKTTKDLHMAYSKGWGMIKKAEAGFGFDFISRYGARGSKLTPEGERFLERYDEYESRVQEFAKKTFEEVFGDL